MNRLLLSIPILLLFATCNRSTGPDFYDPGYLISNRNADSLNIEFTWYDRITITHHSGSSVRSRDFKGVGIGFVDSSGYRESNSASGSYDGSTDAFSFTFRFPLVLDSTKTETIIRVRYYHREFGFTDVDTTILQYKYPYPSAEILVDNSVFTYPNQHFQALVRIGSKIYFHPTGGFGLFEYDLMTGEKRELYLYGGGDALAADSIFVFCDLYHTSVGRFNLSTNTKDLDFPFLLGSIRGLETYQGLLYVVDDRNYPSQLYRFTYDGSFVDSTNFPWFALHITINDGLLYAGTASTTIRRIDLATMSELPSVAAPARNMEGISIYKGYLYFCDYYKSIVGSMPLQDLQ